MNKTIPDCLSFTGKFAEVGAHRAQCQGAKQPSPARKGKFYLALAPLIIDLPTFFYLACFYTCNVCVTGTNLVTEAIVLFLPAKKFHDGFSAYYVVFRCQPELCLRKKSPRPLMIALRQVCVVRLCLIQTG